MIVRRYLTIIFSICAFALSAYAYDCKIDGIYYNLDKKNNTAAVTCKEMMKPSYKGSVSIPHTITYNGAAYSVTAIDWWAFANCNLTSISIPNSVTYIGGSAFRYCSGLTSIEIPNSVKTIDGAAFKGCFNLASISIPNSVTDIGEYAFEDCSGLTQMTIPNSVTSIGEAAFYECSGLTQLTIPNSVTSIGKEAFYGCSGLTQVNIPNSVTSIGVYAFGGCSGLTQVNIPNSVTSIGAYAFSKCTSLASITISNSLIKIADNAFLSCPNLKEVIVPNDYHKNKIGYFSESIIKRVMPAETIEQYFAYHPYMSWEDYYSMNHTKNIPQINKDEISDIISKDIENWQKKGEFESTSAWSQRVNEQTRAAKIDSLKRHYIGVAQRELNEYQQEIETLQKNYQTAYKLHYDNLSNNYIEMLTQLKTEDFKKEVFELNAPYDADNQSFLIQTSTYGDILLPVAIPDAPSFKENWASIRTKIKPTFTFNGKDAVLSKLIFTNNGKDYVYDSHTEAKYAVADINYNFAPLELETADFDLRNIDITAPEIGSPQLAGTVAQKSAASGLDRKKVEIGRQSITVGNAPVKADVDTSIPRVDRNADKTFALIIANENYRREGSVPFALNDGKILAEYFKSTMGIPEKNIQLYSDASLNDIKYGVNKLSKICDAFGNQASVIVYYAGHGIPDEKNGNAHLLPVDGYGSDVTTGYSLDELYETLGNLPSKQTFLLLDACFSGSQRNGTMMASNARGVRIKAKSCVPKGNLIVLSATQGDETAYPYEEKQHGLFTYFLLKKLNEEKGNVTLGDLTDYIIANVKQTSILINDKLQTPTINVSPDLSSSWQNIRIGQ